MTYQPKLHIGEWLDAGGRELLPVENPATGVTVAQFPVATIADLDHALECSARGFSVWRTKPALQRSAILRRAAELMRERKELIAGLITLEQGKPLREALLEAANGADITEWFAEEGRRAYGRVIPARQPGIMQIATVEPIGPVAAFSPWNFPVSQAVRKIAGSLAAGCSIILKGPEDTPSSVCETIRCYIDAGVDADALSLVFGRPPEISSHLIPSPVIRKVSFTGSVPVGKHLAMMAAEHMKPCTMELGGHGPAVVFDDVDPAKAAAEFAAFKFRNAGQVCISPTRFFVQDAVHDTFLEEFVSIATKLKVGVGQDEASQMGPLANKRRIDALEELVTNAVAVGATLHCGGERIGNQGNFFAPTVLSDIPDDARIMQEEPFGPVALINRFTDEDEAWQRANATAYGLASYAYTRDGDRAQRAGEKLDSGMVSINHFGLATAETPFGGVKESGYGREGGIEGLDAYLITKFTTRRHYQ
ncbi:NAD-dependent succinate-semialdehyde dehydrogenase [Microbaculum sp. FT89]|uniref:NAD-dependent succinate-semialdehyde dehydrogenase n=1 Tax=Microbaculum sp. FT89 TaxID=3447298 RepID=UPI003F52C7D7